VAERMHVSSSSYDMHVSSSSYDMHVPPPRGAQEVAERQCPSRAPEEAEAEAEEEEEEEEEGGSPRLFKAKAGTDASVPVEVVKSEVTEKEEEEEEEEEKEEKKTLINDTLEVTVTGPEADTDGRVPGLEDRADRPLKTPSAPPLPPPLPPPDTRHGEPDRDKGEKGKEGKETTGQEGKQKTRKEGKEGDGGCVVPRNSWHFFEEDYERKMVVDELVVRRQLALYMRRGWEHDKRVLRVVVPLKRAGGSRLLAQKRPV